MTNNEPRTRMARELDPTKDAERNLPCFVHHEDAGGRCEEPAIVEVYGLYFCAAHGDEITLGASLEEHQRVVHIDIISASS